MLAPWKKSYDQPRSILKNRAISLSTKVCLVKAMVFPVVMYGCDSWTIKKAERRRIDAFELWCWRRLLRVPWTARRSNKSILKEISPEYSLEGLMLKLKRQYFGHLMPRADSLVKEEKGTTEHEMVGWCHQLDGHESEQALGVGDGQGDLASHSPWGRKKSWTQLSDWTDWTDGKEQRTDSIKNMDKSQNCQAEKKKLKLKSWYPKLITF